MTDPFRIFLRPFAVIVMTIALLSPSSAPMLAQEATPITEDPIPTATASPEQTPEAAGEEVTEEISVATPGMGMQTRSMNTTSAPESFLMEPFATLEGTVVYVHSTDPIVCRDEGAIAWSFTIQHSDPSITYVLAEFSNGQVIALPTTSNNSVAYTPQNTQYMLVNAWAYSELPNSPATLALNLGPCNNTPIDDDQVYQARFPMSLTGHTPGTGAFDNVSWVLVEEELGDVAGGSLVGLETLIIPNLPSGNYTISFSDSTNQLKAQDIQFTIDNQNHSEIARLFSASATTPLQINIQDQTNNQRLEGVSVHLVSSDGTVSRTESTRSDGSIDFGSLPDDFYSVSITPPGYVPYYQAFQVSGTSIIRNIPLTPVAERSLSGTVVDRDTQETIEGASVTLTSPNPLVESIVTTSGGEGDYIITAHNAIWNLTISAPGYFPMSAQINMITESQVLYSLLQPIPQETPEVTLQVATSDDGSPEGITFEVRQGETVVSTGEVGANGTAALTGLRESEGYKVYLSGAAAGYQDTSHEFLVIASEMTVNVTVNPVPTTQNITLQVITRDSAPAANSTFVIKRGEFVEFSGPLDASGSFTPGELPLGTEYEVTITDAPAGYQSKTENFTVTSGVPTWTMTLEPLQHQTVTLQVTTSDSALPTGAAYSIKLGPNVEFQGTLDATGLVSLGELEQDAQYVVTIDGTDAGYQPATKVFTVIIGESNWNLTLEPIPPQTQEITVNVQTTDSGDVGGFVYNITGNAPGGTSGVMQFSNHIELGELQVGAEFSVFINGTNQGYEQKTVGFTVTSDQPAWNITLSPLPPPSQNITLHVSTNDSETPAGALYTVMHGENEVASGTLDASGSVDLGALPVGESYVVSIDGAPAEYQLLSHEFTVELNVSTWTMTLQAIEKPNVTVHVHTEDGESPSGIPILFQIGNGPVAQGEIDSSGEIPLGEILPGTTLNVWIDASGTGYKSLHYHFTVNAHQEMYEVTLGLEYSVVLQVNTRDGGNPEGARYTLKLGDRTAYSGGFPESGVVTLSGMPVGVTYGITIDGEQAGYQTYTDTYTVTEHQGTLIFELEPVSQETTSIDVTLKVSTNDGGSLEDATYTISEAQPQAASSGFIDATLLQVTTPIIGTLPANGEIVVGDLTIGSTYIVSVDGEPAGYSDITTNFTVDAASPTWEITLQALQPVETETPTQTPTVPPTPTATGVPVTKTPTPTATSEQMTPTATTPAGTPDAPTEPESAPVERPVSGLPTTGAGSGSAATVILMATGLILVAIAAGFAIRRGNHQ